MPRLGSVTSVAAAGTPGALGFGAVGRVPPAPTAAPAQRRRSSSLTDSESSLDERDIELTPLSPTTKRGEAVFAAATAPAPAEAVVVAPAGQSEGAGVPASTHATRTPPEELVRGLAADGARRRRSLVDVDASEAEAGIGGGRPNILLRAPTEKHAVQVPVPVPVAAPPRASASLALSVSTARHRRRSLNDTDGDDSSDADTSAHSDASHLSSGSALSQQPLTAGLAPDESMRRLSAYSSDADEHAREVRGRERLACLRMLSAFEGLRERARLCVSPPSCGSFARPAGCVARSALGARRPGPRCVCSSAGGACHGHSLGVRNARHGTQRATRGSVSALLSRAPRSRAELWRLVRGRRMRRRCRYASARVRAGVRRRVADQ